MVQFEKDKFIITVNGHENPAEMWNNVLNGILDLMYFTNRDNLNEETFYRVILLMKAMIPEPEDIKVPPKQKKICNEHQTT